MKSRLERAGAAILLLAASLAAHAECRLVRIAEWTVNPRRPVVEATIDGQKAGVLLDTGADLTLLTRSGAARLGLERSVVESVRSYGLGGESRVESARIGEFRLGSATRKDWRLLVVGEHDMGPDIAMLLGDDFLSNFDVELDLAHGAVRLFQPQGCERAALGYWSKDALAVDMQPGRNIVVPVAVNGYEMNALLDTGAARSVMAARAAESAGLPKGKAAGCFVGLGKERANGWFAPMRSFTLGAETIRDTDIAVADFGRAIRPAEVGSRLGKPLEGFHIMILGRDFLAAHRVLVARSQRKVYFSYTGGAVFPADPGPACDAAAPDPDTRIANAARALERDPSDTAALRRRANALAQKGDYAAALADFDAVLALRPDDENALYSRATLLHAMKDYAAAVPAYDAFLAKRPGEPVATENRAIALIHLGRLDEALAGAQRTLAANPRSKRALRLRGTVEFVNARYAQAARDFAEWHRIDPDDWSALWVYLAELRAGRDAGPQLFNYRREAQPAKWPAPIIRFHLGEIGDEALLAQAARGENPRDRECEARFNIAQRRIADGSAASGIPLLRQAAEACPPFFDEYFAARAELERLERK